MTSHSRSIPRLSARTSLFILLYRWAIMLSSRCILCARSGYFAAMLSGPWSESNSDEIELIGWVCCFMNDGVILDVFRVAPEAMEIILLYMYGAVPNLDPSQCNITHVLAAADMYGLCGLMESVAYALRRYYCHFFHKVRFFFSWLWISHSIFF